MKVLITVSPYKNHTYKIYHEKPELVHLDVVSQTEYLKNRLASSFEFWSREFKNYGWDANLVFPGIEQFQKANRDDLLKIEQSEIDVINQYLPNQKTEEETEIIINNLIKANNLENLKDMGKLMGFVKKDYPGEVDMGLVSKIAKSKLGN